MRSDDSLLLHPRWKGEVVKALLVEPKLKRAWGHNNQHVGLLRIANWLQSTGHTIEYVCHPELPTFQPDEVFVTSMFTYAYRSVWEAVSYYKMLYPRAKLSLGGVYATICPEHARQSGADEVVVGRHPQAREYAPDPTVLPYKQDFAYLFTSYGCNRACTYCATHILFGKGVEQTPPDKVLGEIEFLVGRGFKKIWIGDDNLLHNAEGHINVLCEKIIQRELKVDFRVPGGMAAKDFTLETALLMRRAGFKEISFAIESISADVLKRMGRGNNATPDDLIRALGFADEAGFDRGDTNVYFIIGLPYQSLDDMLATLCFLVSLGVWAHPQRLAPIPGTVDWKRMGLERWDYEDLYYGTFVAPEQDHFSHDDLRAIYKAARNINMGRRYSGIDLFRSHGKAMGLFRNQMKAYCDG